LVMGKRNEISCGTLDTKFGSGFVCGKRVLKTASE